MQILPIYLYQNIFDVTLDLDPTVKGVNQTMYQRDLVVQKGLKNQVRIQFKNSDQKKIRIYSTQTFVFSMVDAIHKNTILEKPLEILDVATTATKGLAQLTLTESDTADLQKSLYNFSIKMLDAQGNYVPTYSNTYYGIVGTVQISDDIQPVSVPSTSISSFSKVYNPTILKYEHFSGNLYAQPEFNGNTALHTFAFHLTGFRGVIYIEGTLDNSPGAGASWTTEFSKVYNQFTGVDYCNLNGVFSYFRVKFVPGQEPGGVDNDNPSYYGSVDKILYRS